MPDGRSSSRASPRHERSPISCFHGTVGIQFRDAQWNDFKVWSGGFVGEKVSACRTSNGRKPILGFSIALRSSPVEVDPIDRDRLWIVLEEHFRQQHLEVAVLQRNVHSRFTIAANHANRHPVRTFGVQWRVFLAFLPQSHPLPVVGTRHRSIERDVAVRGPEVLRIFQVQTQQIRFDQPTSSLSCFGLSASGLLDAVFTQTPHLCFILEIDV